MLDRTTVAYFDRHSHEYSIERLAPCLQFIQKHAPMHGSSLMDIGCGRGNILEHIRNCTPITRLYGVDVSPSCTQTTGEKVGCEVQVGSVTEEDFMATAPRGFDFVLMAALLHHLVGNTRLQSEDLAKKAIKNALKLLRIGGYLLILEPTFAPPYMMTLVFHIKNLISKITIKRLPIFSYWNNLGAPVVSYYTLHQLKQIISDLGDCEIVVAHNEYGSLSTMMRLAGITYKADTTLIARKTSVL